tara:strand:- start:57 stop:230 length:174 start_codon:yes stop_codon:yes gene_type:complete
MDKTVDIPLFILGWINDFYETGQLMNFQKRYVKNNYLLKIKIKYPYTYKKLYKYLED